MCMLQLFPVWQYMRHVGHFYLVGRDTSTCTTASLKGSHSMVLWHPD